MSDALAQIPFRYVVGAADTLPLAGPDFIPELVDIEVVPNGRFRVRFMPVRHGDQEDSWWRWSPESAARLGPGVPLPHEVHDARVHASVFGVKRLAGRVA